MLNRTSAKANSHWFPFRRKGANRKGLKAIPTKHGIFVFSVPFRPTVITSDDWAEIAAK